MTLEELFKLYQRKRLRGCSDRTSELYLVSLRSFEKTLGRPGTVDDLIDDNLEDHMWRVVKDGNSPATANKDRAQITAMWRFANVNRIVETWPNVPKMKEPERVPLGWLPHEVDALFNSADKERGTISGVKASLWWRGLLNLILDTGERIGAVRKVQKKDIHGAHVLIPSQLRKGRTRDKLYSPCRETLVYLAEISASTKGPDVFPWEYTETYLYNKFNKILERAELPTDARSKFHRIRRTVASAVANQGGNPTAALDHADAKTTKRYLDPRIVEETPTSEYVQNWRKKNKKNNDQKDAG